MTALAYETYHLGTPHDAALHSRPRELHQHHLLPDHPAAGVQPALTRTSSSCRVSAAQESYLAYLVPGQIVFTSFFAVAFGGYGMLVEYRTGYIDKLRASPINRWSILAGETVPLFFQAAAMSAVVLIIGLLAGRHDRDRSRRNSSSSCVLSGLFGVALAGISFIPALITKSEQATSTFSLLLFPVIFASTAFVPETLMPDWLRTVNEFNPISYMIEAIRSLMTTGYDWQLLGTTVVMILILGVILQAGTLWAFARLAR